MISKKDIKIYMLLIVFSILVYKLVNTPGEFIRSINSLGTLFKPFLFATLFVLLINPLVNFFTKRLKIKKSISVLISYILFLFIIFLIIMLFVPSIINTINQLVSNAPNYIFEIEKLVKDIFDKNPRLSPFLPIVTKNVANLLSKLTESLAGISTNILSHAINLTSAIFNLFISLVLSIYIICDKEDLTLFFKRLLNSLFTRSKFVSIIKFLHSVHDVFYHYIIGVIIDSIIVGVIAFIGFKFLLNLDNALFLAMIICVTNIIPFFGPFIGAVPPLILTLLQDPSKTIWVAVFILILQQLDGNYIAPKVMGHQVGLRPIWVISSILIIGNLFGLVGIFLAVPIVALIKISIDKYIESNLNIDKSN